MITAYYVTVSVPGENERRMYFSRSLDADMFAADNVYHARPVPIRIAESLGEVPVLAERAAEDRALAKLSPEERRVLRAMFVRQESKALPDTAAGSALGNASVLPQ